MVKNEEIQTEFNTFMQVWKFYKKWYGVTNYDGGDWNKVIHDAHKIALEFENSVLVQNLLHTCITDLERVSRELYRKTNY